MLARPAALGQFVLDIVNTMRKTRAIAVQLTPQTIKRLDELAEASGMSRHRYMILILERAVMANVIVREQVAFSNEHP
jgi:predicted transcriptional regulator